MARGRQTLTQRIALDGGEQIRRELGDLGKAGEAAFKQLDAALNKTKFGTGISTALKGLRTQFEAVQVAGTRLGRSFNTFTLAANTFGRALQNSVTRVGLYASAVTGAVTAVALFARHGVNAVDEADRQAQALGLTIGQFSLLAGAAQQSSVSQDDFVAAMSRLNVVLGESEDEVKGVKGALDRLTDTSIKVVRGPKDLAKALGDSSDALGKLGLSVSKLIALNPEDRVLAIATAFSKLPDGPTKGAIATELFGKALAIKLIPFLNQGGDALRQVMDDLKTYGVEITEADKKTARLADTALDRLSLAFFALRRNVQLAFAPALTEGANALTEVIKRQFGTIRAFATYLGTKATQLVKDFFAVLRGDDEAVENKFLIGIRDTIKSVITGAKDISVQVKAAFFKVKESLEKFVIKFNAAFGTDFTVTSLLVTLALLKITGGFDLLTSGLALAAAGIQLAGAALLLLGVSFGSVGIGVLAAIAGIVAFSAFMAELTGVPFPLALWITGGFASTTTVILVFWDEFVAMASAAFEQVKAGALAALAFIADTWTNGATFIGIVAEAWINGFANVWSTITAGASSAWESLKSAAKSALDFVQSIVSSVISAINRALSALRSLRSEESGGGGGGGGGSGFKHGGPVRGAGSGTSDSILAWLSNNEFVVRASAVRQPGALSFLEALNSGRLRIADLLAGLRGFNLGGLAESLAPRFPAPSLALAAPASAGGSGRAFTLVIDGQSFAGLTAPEDTARRLIKMAVGKQVRSNGRKPGWWGSNRS